MRLPIFQQSGSQNGGAPTDAVEFFGDVRDNGSAVGSPFASAATAREDRPNAIVQNARREFASAFGDLARGKRNWQIVAFVLGAVAVLQGLTMSRLAASAHPVPYVVQTDRLGTVTAVSTAERMRDPDSRLVASQLAAFLRAVRTVLPSAAATAQADLIRRGYAFAAADAAGFLNTYFSDPLHDPRVIGLRATRDVRVTSALRVPEPVRPRDAPAALSQTWRVQWLETERSVESLEQSQPARVARWEGYLTVQIVPPRSIDGIQDNPLGIRITSVSWTRVAGEEIPRDSVGILTGQFPAGGTQ
jgi:type IV secretion system protein VirB5